MIEVKIKVTMNPDRTVREARLLNTHLMIDATYRAIAESALKAVLKFKSRPLELSPHQYEEWKEITITLTPRNFS